MIVNQWTETIDELGNEVQYDHVSIEHDAVPIIVRNSPLPLVPVPQYDYLGKGGDWLCSATGPWHELTSFDFEFTGRSNFRPRAPGGYTMDGAQWLGGPTIFPDGTWTPKLNVGPLSRPTARVDLTLALHLCSWWVGERAATSPPRADGLTAVATWRSMRVMSNTGIVKLMAVNKMPDQIPLMHSERPPVQTWGRYDSGRWHIGVKPALVIRASSGSPALTWEMQQQIARSLDLFLFGWKIAMAETWRMRDVTPQDTRDDFAAPTTAPDANFTGTAPKLEEEP